jgi:hypothetical protein
VIAKTRADVGIAHVIFLCLLMEAFLALVIKEWGVFSGAKHLFIAAIVILVPAMYALSAWWHRGAMNAKDDTIKSKDATIDHLRERAKDHDAEIKKRDGRIEKLIRDRDARETTPSEQMQLHAAISELHSAFDEIGAPREAPESPEERVFSDLPIETLLRPFKEHTSVQANAMVGIYLGTWLKVTGSLYNVEVDTHVVRVVIDANARSIRLLFLYFSVEWAQKLSVLQRGSVISAIGKIDRLEEGSLSMKHCELTT